MKYLLLIVLALISSILSGCFGPVAAPTTSSYMLNTTPAVISHRHPRNSVLLVMAPDTLPAYNTTQMAYTTKPYQISYFGLNQWAETPSQMLQPLLVQTLQNTHYYHAVTSPPYSGHNDYILLTQILKLQQDYTRCPHVVEFTLRAQMLQVSTNQIVASKQFAIVVPIMQKTPYSGVIAANQATSELLHDIAVFCLNNTK